MLGFDLQNKVMITMDINQRLQEVIEGSEMPGDRLICDSWFKERNKYTSCVRV